MRISRILVTGANGAVGSDLVPTLLQKGFKVLATDIDCPADNLFPMEYMDVRNVKQIQAVFKNFKPQAAVHLAAETDVEYCELNPKHAYETNAQGTKNVAKTCAKNDTLLIYVSSIGVFDGKKKGPYKEEDRPNPINIYGKTKLEGEKYVQELKKYFIVRAGWMIGGKEKDKKFVAKILKLVRRGVKQLDVVTDKRGTPTYTVDLSEAIANLVKTDLYGTYHVGMMGNPTRFEIAKRILEKLNRPDIEINPVTSNALSKIYFAPRPNNESQDPSKINSLFPNLSRPWTERLDQYLMILTGSTIEEALPKFSIIICFYVDVPRFYKDLKKFGHLKYKNFEVVIVSDKEIKLPNLSFPVKLVLTGKKRTGVGEKRDYALGVAKGDFIAYIDDDAYPNSYWLSNALPNFKDPRIGAVGGPNLTPIEDPFLAKVSGDIYGSYCTSGEVQYRFLPGHRRSVSEIQGVNMIIRKDILTRLGGFKTKLYSGDDSKICSNIRSLGYEIIYDPNVRVYHHRRLFPFDHLKQIRTIGTHRGFFVKAYPDTLSPMYYLPMFLTAGFFFGTLGSFLNKDIKNIFIVAFLLFFLLGFISVVKRAGVIRSLVVALGIILTHITYGVFFVYGLTRRTLPK